jgi:hypothetical protein
MELEFCRQMFEKYSDIKTIYENPSTENRVVPCGQTDRYGEANSRFYAVLRTRLKMGHKILFFFRDMVCVSSPGTTCTHAYAARYHSSRWIVSNEECKSMYLRPTHCCFMLVVGNVDCACVRARVVKVFFFRITSVSIFCKSL